MFNGKGPKYYKKIKPHQEYQVYSQSDTSLATWEYADEPKKIKHVKFDSDYDYLSHDNYYGGRQKNVYSYPYHYDSSNEYETGNEIHNYDSEDSRYTQYHQSPQQIMYTGTDSEFTTVDSDYEHRGFDYQPKYRHDNSHGYRRKTNVSTKKKDIQGSSFGGDISLYFARQPTSHQTFKYRDPTRHDMSSSSTSEPEFQRGSLSETDEESDYPPDNKDIQPGYQVYATRDAEPKTNRAFYATDNKGKQPGYQVYATNVADTETNGAFKTELTNDSQEMLISVTDYDNVPLLAFKSKNTNVSPQKSTSRVVYLPVLVTDLQKNEEKMLTSNKNITPQLFPSKNIEMAEKPVESLKVYAATNTGQKNIFEKLSSKNRDNTHLYKTKDNKHHKSTVLRAENTESNPNRTSKSTNRKSDLKPVSKQSKTSYTYLPSILRMPGAKKSKSSINDEFPTSELNQLNQSEIKQNRSNTSVTSKKSITTANNKKIKKENNKVKKSSIISRKGAEDLTSNIIFDNKKYIPKTKSSTSNISGKSSKSSTSTSTKRRARKTNMTSKNTQGRLLIGESPSGSEKGSSYYHKAHQRELKARKDKKSKIIQGKQETKPSTSKEPTRPDESELSMSRKSKANNNNMIKSTNDMAPGIQAQSKLTKGPSDVKTDESNFTLKENEDKNKVRQSVVRQSTVKPQEKSVSVVGTSRIINKSVLPQVVDNTYKKETDVKSKNRKESDIIMIYEPKTADGSKTILAKESITVRKTNVSINKNDTKNQENNKTIEHQTVEGRKHESQHSDPITPIQSNRKSIARESTTFRDTKTLPQKSIMQTPGNSTVVGQDKAEENKLQSQYSDQNQTAQASRKSLVKESIKGGETKPFSKTNSVQNQDSYTLIKQDGLKERKINSHLSDPNKSQASEEEKGILYKKSQIHDYQSKEKKSEDTKKSVVKETTGAAEEIKSTGQRTSQLFQNQSKDKINEDTKKSVVKETTEEIKSTGQRKSRIFQTQSKEKSNDDTKKSVVNETTEEIKSTGQIFQTQSKEKSNEDTKKSVVKETTGATEEIKSTGRRKSQIFQFRSIDKMNEDNKNSFVQKETTDARDKGSLIGQKMPSVGERKSKVNEVSDNNREEQTGKKGGSAVSLTLPIEHDTGKNQKSTTKVNNPPPIDLQQTAIQERQSSNVIKNSDQKSISKGAYIPVGEQKQELKSGKNRDKDISTDKSFKTKMSEKKSSTGSNRNQSKGLTNKKKASRVKSIHKQSNLNKTEYCRDHPIKLWGYDFSMLIAYCFQISQFILGVSTYDKFIEVLGNFH